MAAASGRQPGPDLYRVLGVPRDASRQEIALAWRRQARRQHPDARPGDTQAADRFRTLARAWQVLGDPDRRAAYDTTPGSGPPATRVRVTVRRPPGGPGALVAGPPLVAGPVRVQAPGGASPAAGRCEREQEVLRLAMLALRCLAPDPEWPW